MWLYLIAAGIIIFIVVKGWLAHQDATKSFIIRPCVYLNLKKGIRFDIEEDYMNPNDIIRHDLNSGQPYVIRKTSSFDKGEKKIPLSKYYRDFNWEGFRLIVDNLEVFSEWAVSQVKEKDEKIVFLTNENTTLASRVAEMENKFDEIMGKKIEMQEKMNVASRKGIPQKPFKQNTGGSAYG